jgi:hypothetical protein
MKGKLEQQMMIGTSKIEGTDERGSFLDFARPNWADMAAAIN